MPYVATKYKAAKIPSVKRLRAETRLNNTHVLVLNELGELLLRNMRHLNGIAISSCLMTFGRLKHLPIPSIPEKAALRVAELTENMEKRSIT